MPCRNPWKARTDSIPARIAKKFPTTQTNFTIPRFCKPCTACAVSRDCVRVGVIASRFLKVQRVLLWVAHRMGDFKSLESGMLHIALDFPFGPLPGTIIFVTSRKWSDTPNSPASPDITAQTKAGGRTSSGLFHPVAAGSFFLKNHANLLYHFCTNGAKIYIELYRFL